MRVGLVILSYGGSGLHTELVSRLLTEGLSHKSLLVVHNPDGTPAGSRPEGAGDIPKIVMGRNMGYGAAMNAGIEYWRGQGADWVLLLTHDVRPLPGALKALKAAAARASDYGVLGPTLVTSEGHPFSFGGINSRVNITEHLTTPRDGVTDGIAPCDWVDGTALMLRLRTIGQVGGLDSGFFMYFEEAEFCLRARRAGWRVGVVLEAQMATAPGRSRRPLAFGYLFARNGIRYTRRAGGRRAVWQALRGQVTMTRWLIAMPYNRRFWDREFRRSGYPNAVGIWLGAVGAAIGQVGPPPRFIRRLSDISGVDLEPAPGNSLPDSVSGEARSANGERRTVRPAVPLRIAMFPELLSTDPYCQLLDGALRRRGHKISRERALRPRWARAAIGTVDVVHLHWVEFMYWPGGRSRVHRECSMWAQGGRFIAALWILRRAGVRIIWTSHHLVPRESPHARLHRLLQRSVVATADALVAHSGYAAKQIVDVVKPKVPVHVVPHGGYAGVYAPAAESRNETRRRLALPEGAFVYLLFGNVRDYKRVPQAIWAFRQLKDADARLLVTGAAGALRSAVEVAAAGDARIRLELEAVPDADLAAILQAADVMVLNYGDVFSSGVLLLALAFGVPLIAPESGGAAELAPPPATVQFNEGHLVDALKEARVEPKARRAAAQAAGKVPNWDKAAFLLERIYRNEADQSPAVSGGAKLLRSLGIEDEL